MSDERRPTDSELANMLHVCPEAGSTWVHTKTGNRYAVVVCAIREADLQPVVIYRRTGGSSLVWCRPLSEWLEYVEVEGGKARRFRPEFDDCWRCGCRRVTGEYYTFACWRCGEERSY